MLPKTNKHAHSDNSLSSFITGAAFGALVALLLGTEKGRSLAKEIFQKAKKMTDDLEVNLENLPSSQNSSTSSQPKKQVLNRLKRNISSSDSNSFTKDGQPLKS